MAQKVLWWTVKRQKRKHDEALPSLYRYSRWYRFTHLYQMSADYQVPDIDLDTDPFAQCEQDLLDRPPVREFPDLDEDEV